VSDLSRRLADLPDDHLVAEIQSALDNLQLTDLVPAPEPFVWKPNDPDPDGDRDYPGPEICPQCDHQLRLDSEGRCSSCGFC
jgi:hypothetical protein